MPSNTPKKLRGIAELPTQAYKDWYDALNERLDHLVELGAELLRGRGCRAAAQTRARAGAYGEDCCTVLPHKTVATRAGLGWIGKCALLVTEQYGSMVRLSSILTDAPLTVSEPVSASKCGQCTACKSACPARAIHGNEWNPSLSRDTLIDFQRCRAEAQSRSERGFGQRADLCGKCIEICPYTQRYLGECEDA